MSKDVQWLATHTKSWKKDFAEMKAKIARHVLEAGPDPYAGWTEGWPKWALSFKESLLARREGELRRKLLQAVHAAGEPVPSKWLRSQKRKERKALAAAKRKAP